MIADGGGRFLCLEGRKGVVYVGPKILDIAYLVIKKSDIHFSTFF